MMKSPLLLLISAMLLASSALAIDAQRLTQALNDPSRDAADRERDASRKPVEVLQFMGVEEGMTVLDIMASGGWYTEVLSHAVGPEGTVLMQNSPRALGMRNTEEAVQARLAGNRLPNVERVDRDFSDLGIAPNSVDFAITALNYHDLYNADPAAAQAMLAAVKEVLRPGGVLGLLDHKGSFGADNATLHRIALEDVIMSVTEAGFHVAGMSDVLHVPSDDHTLGPFAPELGRNTDRIVLKLVKP
jgi:predicted methyltransferase